MGYKTPNYGFPQLEITDLYRIKDFNDGWQLSDDLFKRLEDKSVVIEGSLGDANLKITEVSANGVETLKRIMTVEASVNSLNLKFNSVKENQDRDSLKITGLETKQAEFELGMDGLKQDIDSEKLKIDEITGKVTNIENKSVEIEFSLDTIKMNLSHQQTEIDSVTGSVTNVVNKTNELERKIDGNLSTITNVQNIVGQVSSNMNNMMLDLEEKSNTYFARPIPPYKVGDLLSDPVDGRIYICIKDREDGLFDIDDWYCNLNYTDDSLGYELAERLQEADSKIEYNKSEISKIDQKVDEISLNVTSATEAIVSINEDVVFMEERLQEAEIKLQPDNINLSVKDQIDIAKKEAIDTSKAEMNSAIQAIQTGARNLLINSAPHRMYYPVEYKTTNMSMELVDDPQAPYGKALHIFGDGDGSLTITSTPVLVEGQEYHIGYDLRGNGFIGIGLSQGNYNVFQLNSSYRPYDFIFTASTADVLEHGIHFVHEGVGTYDLYMHSTILERGNQVHDWSPAPEDAMENMTSIKQELKSEIDLKADGIELNSFKQTTESKLTTIDGTITGVSDRVTTNEANIALNANQINLRVTKDDYNTNNGKLATDITNAKNDAIASAESNLATVIKNHPTKAEVTAEINLKADEITLGVSQGYTSKSEFDANKTTVTTAINTAKNDAVNTANTNTTNVLKSYPTNTNMESAIDTKASELIDYVTDNFIDSDSYDANNTAMTDAINKAKTDAINTANANTTSTLTSYSTTAQMNSAITAKANEINLGVSNTYTTKSDFDTNKTTVNTAIGTAKTEAISTAGTNADTKIATNNTTINGNIATAKAEAISSANTNTNNVLKSYSTTTEMNSAINTKADEINLGVSKTYTTKSDYDTLNGEVGTIKTTVSSHTASINLLNNQITSKVEKTEFDTAIAKVVVSSETQFYLSTSTTTATGGAWQSTPPTWTIGKYMWQRDRDKYKDGTYSAWVERCIAGAQGQPGNDGAKGADGATGATGATGADGNSLVSVTNYYMKSSSSSGITNASSGWVTPPAEMPVLDATNKYMWHYQLYTYSKTSAVKTTAMIVGVYGDKGLDGTNGTNGTNGAKGDTGATGATGQGVTNIIQQYYRSTSNVAQSGGAWSNSMPAWAVSTYLWVRNQITWSNPTATTTTSPWLDTSWDKMNDLNTQVSTAIQDITPEKIINKVSVALGDGRVIQGTSTTLTKDAFTLKGGTFKIQDAQGNDALVADTSGNLNLAKELRIYSYGTINSNGIFTTLPLRISNTSGNSLTGNVYSQLNQNGLSWFVKRSDVGLADATINIEGSRNAGGQTNLLYSANEHTFMGNMYQYNGDFFSGNDVHVANQLRLKKAGVGVYNDAMTITNKQLINSYDSNVYVGNPIANTIIEGTVNCPNSGIGIAGNLNITGGWGDNGLYKGNGDNATWDMCNMDIRAHNGLGIKDNNGVRKIVFQARQGNIYTAGHLCSDRHKGNSNDNNFYIGSTNSGCRIDTTNDNVMRLYTSWGGSKDYGISNGQGSIGMLFDSVNKHIFYSNGTKTGGTIDIEGTTYGMAPTDSPQCLIEYLEYDIDVNGEQKIMLDHIYAKSISKYAVFSSNPDVRIVRKDKDGFVVNGVGVADFNIKGQRIDGQKYYDIIGGFQHGENKEVYV